MKKLIYLPLTALVLFTGCKGPSFITQRYTKFHHSLQKKSNEDKLLVKEYSQKPSVNKQIIVLEPTNDALLCSASLKENSALPTSEHLKLHTATILANTQNTGIANTLVNNEQAKNYTLKTTPAHKATKAKGLVGWALNLVITAISIVIVIIIVLVILALL